MDACKIASKVYIELSNLHNQGFVTWVSKVGALMKKFDLDINQDRQLFKFNCKRAVKSNFVTNCEKEINDLKCNPILRTYTLIKGSFCCEFHFHAVQEAQFRDNINKICICSKDLEIERGRYESVSKEIDRVGCEVCKDKHISF